MTDERDSGDEPHGPVRGAQRPAPVRPRKRRREDAAANEGTSPFPYAENFDAWVADETAARDRTQRPSPAGDDGG